MGLEVIGPYLKWVVQEISFTLEMYVGVPDPGYWAGINMLL